MSIEQILSGEVSEIETAKNQVLQTIADLIRQTNGTVILIKALTDHYGLAVLLEEMSQAEIDLFNLVWSKIVSSADGTGYTVPELSDEPI